MIPVEVAIACSIAVEVEVRYTLEANARHWTAFIGDKLLTAFAMALPKCLETFAMVLNCLARIAGPRSRVARILNIFKIFVRQIFSQNSHRVFAGVSNPSRILLNLVSVSQNVRNVRQCCDRLATYETKL